MTLPYSTRLTMPLMISPTRSLNSSYCRSRSASRICWTMTCLAVCAAMRPKSICGSGSVMKSPTCASGFLWRASLSLICVKWLISSASSSTTSMARLMLISPDLRSMKARMSYSAP